MNIPYCCLWTQTHKVYAARQPATCTASSRHTTPDSATGIQRSSNYFIYKELTIENWTLKIPGKLKQIIRLKRKEYYKVVHEV